MMNKILHRNRDQKHKYLSKSDGYHRCDLSSHLGRLMSLNLVQSIGILQYENSGSSKQDP